MMQVKTQKFRRCDILENAKPIYKDKLNDQVYDQLCTLLREGAFTPGKAIRVSHVAKAFGVSAMPVREALTRLQAVGVVANVSGRSLGVPYLKHDELTDLRDVRLEVETLAVKWALANRDGSFAVDLDALLGRLETAEHSGDVQGYIKANYEFHLRIYQQSASPVLIDIINTLWLRVSPHLYQLTRKNEYRFFNETHRKIVQAFRENDEAKACYELSIDISEAYEDLVKNVLSDKPKP